MSVTFKELQELFNGNGIFTEENIIPYVLLYKHARDFDKFLQFVNNCNDKSILFQLYILGRQINYMYMKPKYVSQNNKSAANMLKKWFTKEMLNVALECGADKSEVDLVRTIIGMSTADIYEKAMFKLNSDLPLTSVDIKLLRKDDIDKIFKNYKKVKNKSRLYSLTSCEEFDEKHLPIAMKYLGFNSFYVRGGTGVPFTLSHIVHMKEIGKKYNLIEFITRAYYQEGMYKAGKTRYKHITRGFYGGNKFLINVKNDMTKEKIERVLFPLLLENEKVYNEIRANLGYICKKCKNSRKMQVSCPECRYNYSKRKTCTRCNATGKVLVACNQCKGKINK